MKNVVPRYLCLPCRSSPSYRCCVNIMPPLSVVDHAIYQSSHTNRKHPPFNIARPSLAKNLELYRDSMVAFVHACESGVFLPSLRNLCIRGSIAAMASAMLR